MAPGCPSLHRHGEVTAVVTKGLPKTAALRTQIAPFGV